VKGKSQVPTLIEDLKAITHPDTDAFRNLTGERAARLRQAVGRLVREIEHWGKLDAERADAVSVSRVVSALLRINGDAEKRSSLPETVRFRDSTLVEVATKAVQETANLNLMSSGIVALNVLDAIESVVGIQTACCPVPHGSYPCWSCGVDLRGAP
jgi:hypothetical protein